MKRIINIIILLFLLSPGLHAQMVGRRFMQGQAGVNFESTKYERNQPGLDLNNYGYSFSVSLGKFKKENLATGWTFGSSLSGDKDNYSSWWNNEKIYIEKKGIKAAEISLLRFWHFYKPLTDKLGIYGGPNISLSYGYGNQYTFNPNSGKPYFDQTKSNSGRVSLGLTGSIYYALTDSWWIEGSLAFANPVFFQYTASKNGMEGDLSNTTNTLEYQLTPQLVIPSVSLGLRYFLK